MMDPVTLFQLKPLAFKTSRMNFQPRLLTALRKSALRNIAARCEQWQQKQFPTFVNSFIGIRFEEYCCQIRAVTTEAIL